MKKRYVISNIVIALTLVCLGTLSFAFISDTPAFMTSKNKPIYKGNPDNAKVALMINVYWGTEYLLPMLDVLDQYGAKCTFFLGGSWADDNNESVNTIKDRGHELANHGYFHKDHKKLSATANKDEILSCEKMVEGISGVKTVLFAPPSGAFSDNTLSVCQELGYKVIMWSKDTIDWRDKNTDLIYKRATDKVSNGDLILMHPTECTLAALPRILQTYKDRGISADIVTNVIA